VETFAAIWRRHLNQATRRSALFQVSEAERLLIIELNRALMFRCNHRLFTILLQPLFAGKNNRSPEREGTLIYICTAVSLQLSMSRQSFLAGGI